MAKPQDPKRVGKWNLEGRWSGMHQGNITGADCDVWLLTELPSRAEFSGFASHRSKKLVADQRHWTAIAVGAGLPISTWDEDPHPVGEVPSTEPSRLPVTSAPACPKPEPNDFIRSEFRSPAAEPVVE